MKMTRLFTAENSHLICLSTNEQCSPIVREVKWSEVESRESEFNEEFLASLREELKKNEERGEFFVIVPVFDKKIETEAQKKDGVAAMKHVARRIKDCASVVGFAVPACLDESYFVSELSEKHQHYCFLTKNGWISLEKN